MSTKVRKQNFKARIKLKYNIYLLLPWRLQLHCFVLLFPSPLFVFLLLLFLSAKIQKKKQFIFNQTADCCE